MLQQKTTEFCTFRFFLSTIDVSICSWFAAQFREEVRRCVIQTNQQKKISLKVKAFYSA